MVKDWLDAFLSIFFPRCCLVCGEVLAKGEECLCARCNMDLPRTNYHKMKDNPVEKLFWGKIPLERATSYFFYRRGGDTRRILHSLKYGGQKEIGEIMGRHLAVELLSSGFFEGIDISTFPFVFEAISREEIVKRHTGKHFYDEFPCNMFAKAVIEKKGYVLDDILTGGSISTSAFSLVKALGFKKIVFIGQDLAFTGGQSYNSGLKMDEKENEQHQKKRVIVQVKGNDGTMLDTDYQMDMYRKWIENEILKLPEDITVINATEGGAKIEGAKVMTLKEVIDSCTKEIDFEKLLQEVPLAFSEEERQDIINEIKEEPKRLEEVKENIKKATKVAEQLEQASKDGNVEEQKKLLTEFGNLNEEIQKEPVQDLLLYYNSEIEFSIGDDVLSADLTIPDLCNRAKAWYKGYESAVDRLIADLHEKFIDRL